MVPLVLRELFRVGRIIEEHGQLDLAVSELREIRHIPAARIQLEAVSSVDDVLHAKHRDHHARGQVADRVSQRHHRDALAGTMF